ncbi:MAG: Sec-independent protein translocase protein TatB [Endozoicomonas sp. (ex Botrylloides leachii)]|nr:Sec-independent protein translocase protein TatB [Endozoicomonas sp. (ex Botrylloides leachii)]
MLDIGFTELLLVGAIALIVLGPERFAEAIKATAYWVGKIRSSMQSIKNELEQEIGTDEIKRQLHNEAVMKTLNKEQGQFKEQDAFLSKAAVDNKKTSTDTVIDLDSQESAVVSNITGQQSTKARR